MPIQQFQQQTQLPEQQLQSQEQYYSINQDSQQPYNQFLQQQQSSQLQPSQQNQGQTDQQQQQLNQQPQHLNQQPQPLNQQSHQQPNQAPPLQPLNQSIPQQPSVLPPISQQPASSAQAVNQNTPSNQTQKPTSNVDLLSGLDLSPSDFSTSTPLLQPKLASQIATDLPSVSSQPNKEVLPQPIQSTPISANVEEKILYGKCISNYSFCPNFFFKLSNNFSEPDAIKSTITNLDRKPSVDNLSVCSDISSIDQNFEWESASVKSDDRKLSADGEAIIAKYKDSFDDPKILKWFHKEVERLEKIMETLNIKTLNGTTHLGNKWKEIQDLLVSVNFM